jgi:Sulfotransferase family
MFYPIDGPPLEEGKLIIVGGAPRSGTTLVQNMLAAHPAVLGGPEALHLHDILEVRRRMLGSLARGWLDFYCDKKTIDTCFRWTIMEVLAPVDGMQGRRYLSEKTPENVLAFADLAELLPEARFVHVVRDPRGVVNSLLKVGRRARRKGLRPAPQTASLSGAIAHTRKCVAAGFAAAAKTPERIHTLVYEKLVSAPEQETRALCAFLGMEWSEQMIRPSAHRFPGEWALTVGSDEVWYTSEEYRRDPEIRNVGTWRKELTRLKQAAIAQAFGDMSDYERLGYVLEASAGARLLTSVSHFLVSLLHQIRHRATSTLRSVRS